MAGIHTILFDCDKNQKISKADFCETLHENNFKLKILNQTAKCLMAVSYYEGYPFMEWRYNGARIIVEGMIYNFSKEEIQAKLNEISSCFASNREYKSLVKQFVETADGDYIVQVLPDKEDRLLIFNDYLGRLPLYYHRGNGLCVFSREIKVILRFAKKISLNKFALAEFLMFEYPLGNKTLFNDIFRLEASKMIVVDAKSGKKNLEICFSSDFSFILKEPFKNKTESINFLKDSFLKAAENRVNVLGQNGYKIIADLSGGYDSRVVLAGLSRFNKNIFYLTQEYIQDESPNAQDVFHKFGSPGNYRKLCFDNTFSPNDFKGLGPLIYKTDGLVNGYTTSVCYKDMQFLKKEIKKEIREPIAHFMGFGGEFIRHPVKLFYNSLLYGIEKGFYSRLSLNIACDMVKLNINTYNEEFKKYLNALPEKTPEDQLRRFYHEYYNHYVGAAGEERHRIHFWIVSPMWSLEFIRTIFSRIPLKWTGYKYYIQFMNAVDPRLLKSPIFGSNINLSSLYSVNVCEAKYRFSLLKGKFSLIARTKMPILHKLLRRSEKIRQKDKKEMLEKLRDYYNRSDYAGEAFDFAVIEKKFPEVDFNRAATLMIYLGEIEKRFGNKI